MKVTLGTKVMTDFGEGPIVAMTEEWCIVLTSPKAPAGQRESAVPWDQVSVSAEPECVASATWSKDIPEQ